MVSQTFTVFFGTPGIPYVNHQFLLVKMNSKPYHHSTMHVQFLYCLCIAPEKKSFRDAIKSLQSNSGVPTIAHYTPQETSDSTDSKRFRSLEIQNKPFLELYRKKAERVKKKYRENPSYSQKLCIFCLSPVLEEKSCAKHIRLPFENTQKS